MTNAQPDRSSQTQFGRLAGAYRASKTHAQAGALASAASMLTDRRYGTAVDIGAGPGFTAFAVASRCDRVIATDVTPEMLEQARSLRDERGAPQTELVLTAAESLSCQDASLDLITCRTAAHHFLNVDAWLSEVQRALTTGGELILIDTISPDDSEATAWMHDIEIWRDPSHVRNLTEAEWLRRHRTCRDARRRYRVVSRRPGVSRLDGARRDAGGRGRTIGAGAGGCTGGGRRSVRHHPTSGRHDQVLLAHTERESGQAVRR